MVRNFWEKSKEGGDGPNPKLQGSVFRFLPVSGYDWPTENPPWIWPAERRPHSKPIAPTYPNGDALTWMALAVLEQANRQINSQQYWEDNFPYVPRYIKSLQITYPSGWTGPELEAYQSKWQKAINLFYSANFDDPKMYPQLEFPIDEAVASQLPVVFSEMEGMGRNGENWLRLMGRDCADYPRARIMTVDIGGGTTDFAIVEYCDTLPGHGVDLEASLILKDSSTIAGDALIKELIESILLPGIGESYEEDDDLRLAFEDLFNGGISDSVQREQWRVITRLGLIPRVTEWLEQMAKKMDIPASPDGKWVDDASRASRDLSAFAKERGLDYVDLFRGFEVPTDRIVEVVELVFKDLFLTLARFVSSFEVDMVVVCGKPSEMPAVTSLLKEVLPISTERTIIANEYPVGNWYPFAKGGKIEDAKTLTAVGVSLYKAIKEERVPGWSIRLQPSELFSYRNFWEVIHNDESCTNILNPDGEAGSVRIMNKAMIGRRLLKDSRPEQVYIFRWKESKSSSSAGSGRRPPAQIEASFRRLPAKYRTAAEGLELVAVKGQASDGSPLTLADYELKLCTLESGEHWIDEARFEVCWPDVEEF